MQLPRRQMAGPLDGVAPQPLEDIPRLAETGRVCRAHPDPVRVPAVELGIDQRCDVDAIDHDVLDLAVYVDVDQLDPPAS
jgi:hypothetical protein